MSINVNDVNVISRVACRTRRAQPSPHGLGRLYINDDDVHVIPRVACRTTGRTNHSDRCQVRRPCGRPSHPHRGCADMLAVSGNPIRFAAWFLRPEARGG